MILTVRTATAAITAGESFPVTVSAVTATTGIRETHMTHMYLTAAAAHHHLGGPLTYHPALATQIRTLASRVEQYTTFARRQTDPPDATPYGAEHEGGHLQLTATNEPQQTTNRITEHGTTLDQ